MEVRWDQVEALFADALVREGDERARLLETAAPGLRREVEDMLAAHGRPLRIEGRVLSGDGAPPAGARVGPYELLEPLGEGGMGAVWRARRVDGVLDREVALKLVRWSAPDLRRRFEAERRVLARLDHPGIVRLLEAGTSAPTPDAPGGRPYFAMDVVVGQPITAYADEHGLTAEARVGLIAQACEAVAHAHRRLVVHRDLKPSNILVTDEGRVRLLDFGIAKLLGDEDDALRTETGVRPMTRAYAAPEQVCGEAATTATDVYALGVVLYELLAGRRPFEASSAAALEEAIRTAAPVRPSAVRTEPGPVEARRLRGDLDAIVLTALRKEPEARYGSTDALASDLRQWLGGLPVSARSPSAGYRLRLFARRHRIGVSAGVVAAVALVAFTAALAVQQRATARERDAAQATAAMLERMLTADPFAAGRPDTLRLRDVLDRGLEQARTDLADQPLVRARLLAAIGRSYVRLGAHPQAEAPLEEAVAVLRGSDPAALAASLADLAAVHGARWRLGEAEALGREALRLAEKQADPTLRGRAEYVLGLVLIDAGRAAEAEALLRASAGRSPAAEAILAEQTLGRAILDQGRFDEAETLFLDLRERIARRYGAADARLVGVLNPLMFLYLATDRTDEADRVGAEAVALMRTTQPGSSTLSQTLAVYGVVLRRQGRLDEAEALLREAIALPPMRPESHAVPYGTLATVLHEQGNLDGAIAAQREAVARLGRGDGAAPSAAFSQIKLARFFREARRLEEAEQVLRSVRPAGAASGHGAQALDAEWAALRDVQGRSAVRGPRAE